VLCINLFGRSLQFGAYRYQHCTECAGLFRQRRQEHTRCPDCRTESFYFTCAVCAAPLSVDQARDGILEVRCALRDPADAHFSPVDRADSTKQLLYFCGRHKAIAVRRVADLDKRDLLDFVRRAQDGRDRRAAMVGLRR
jgi:hypothetical protein